MQPRIFQETYAVILNPDGERYAREDVERRLMTAAMGFVMDCGQCMVQFKENRRTVQRSWGSEPHVEVQLNLTVTPICHTSGNVTTTLFPVGTETRVPGTTLKGCPKCGGNDLQLTRTPGFDQKLNEIAAFGVHSKCCGVWSQGLTLTEAEQHWNDIPRKADYGISPLVAAYRAFKTAEDIKKASRQYLERMAPEPHTRESLDLDPHVFRAPDDPKPDMEVQS